MHAINEPDYSGISIISTIVPQPHTAATLLLVSDGKIRPKSIGKKKKNILNKLFIIIFLKKHWNQRAMLMNKL